MATRTITGRSPRAEARAQELMLRRLENQYRPRLAKEIARAMRAAADKYNEPMGLETVIADHKERLTVILSLLWSASDAAMGNHLEDGLKRIVAIREVKQSMVIPRTQSTTQAMRGWIMSIGAQKITQISDTTRSQVQTMINAGLAQELSEIEISKSIKEVASLRSASRAQTIARTEVHGAAQHSAMEQARAIDLDAKRQWVSAQSERTRQTHIDADGQVVGIYEKFTVGDALLDYPGDYLANAPEETINCRCASVLVFDDD